MIAGDKRHEAAREVALGLRRNGFKAYFVGGCVRDGLLGRQVKDYDIVTDAAPSQVIPLFTASRHVGAHFGVVVVKAGEYGVEVATFRSDHSYRDGRRPDSVSFENDPGKDVLRRDFTINALLEDPETGEILDYTGGRKDLRQRLIRAIGDPEARFAEDHLRMLRAVRFAAGLEFDIEPSTLAAIRTNAAGIGRIAAERVRDELVRILTEGGARRGFELLDESGLLEIILPEISAMKGVEQPPQFHPEGDVWTHTLMLLGSLREPTPTLALGALLHDVGKPPTFRVADRIRFDGHDRVGAEMARSILERLRFSNEDIRQVESLVRMHMRFGRVGEMRESKLKRLLRVDGIDEHLELHRLDCEASHRTLDSYNFCRSRLAEMPVEALSPPRLLTGDDLKAQGYVEGPLYRRILDAVEEAQLENRIATKEEALECVRREFPLAEQGPR